jgi:hypothetical protein
MFGKRPRYYTEADSKLVTGTARTGGAVGLNARVPKTINSMGPLRGPILMYGDGPAALGKKTLVGYGHRDRDVTSYEIGDNYNPGLHDANALKRKYRVVGASNVLNVLPTRDALRGVTSELSAATARGGVMVANYAENPRHGEARGEFTETDVHNFLKKGFNHVDRKRYGGAYEYVGYK